MAAITGKRYSSMSTAALAFVLCVLAQTSLSSCSETGYEAHFGSLPHLPPLSLPKLPFLSLPPLPSRVSIPGVKFPEFTLPTEKPFEHLHLPALPPQKIHIPQFPGFKLPSLPSFPPLPSLKLPGFSHAPTPAKTFTIPKFNPVPLTIPRLTVPKIALPPTTFSFPRRAAVPKAATKKN